MTLILFPLRSEYTVATHTAVLSLLASMCDGVPREAEHTVSLRGQKAEHSCAIPPARQVFSEPLPRKILVARL